MSTPPRTTLFMLMSADGKILGSYVATGAIPEFYEDLRRHGVELDLSIFAKPERRA